MAFPPGKSWEIDDSIVATNDIFNVASIAKRDTKGQETFLVIINERPQINLHATRSMNTNGNLGIMGKPSYLEVLWHKIRYIVAYFSLSCIILYFMEWFQQLSNFKAPDIATRCLVEGPLYAWKSFETRP